MPIVLGCEQDGYGIYPRETYIPVEFIDHKQIIVTK